MSQLELPISDTFPATNQFCCHFAVPFRALTAVSHLARKSIKKSTKGHRFGQQLKPFDPGSFDFLRRVRSWGSADQTEMLITNEEYDTHRITHS